MVLTKRPQRQKRLGALQRARKAFSRTYREHRMRRRIHNVLQSVRTATPFEPSAVLGPDGKPLPGRPLRDKGVGRVITKAKTRAGYTRKPFLTQQPETVFRELDARFLPNRTTAFKVALSKMVRRTLMRPHSQKKEQVIRELFGSGKLGLLMVKPELFAERAQVKNFLRKMGFNVVFSSPFVFSKYDLQRLYPHVTQDRQKYASFAVQSFSLLNAPSQVVLFEHKTPAEYARMAQELGIELKQPLPTAPQDAFCAVFKAFLRQQISRPAFEQKGFKTSGIQEPARTLDAFGFFERELAQGRDMMVVTNGLHFPDSKEIVLDARTLLTLTDLKKLAPRFGG